MILNLVPGILDRPNIPGQIAYRHPDYMARWWWREFYRVSYIGGREYYRPIRISMDFQEPIVIVRTPEGQLPTTTQATAYDINNVAVQSLLFRHNREKSWEFENRRKRAHYLNFIKPITKALVSHAMKKEPTRDGPESLKEFWKAVDEDRDESINDFVKEGSRWAQVMGIMWACVDQDPKGDGMPYCYWVSPLDIFDWGMAADGKSIAWIKQFVYTEKERTWSDPITPVYRFRIWTPTDVTTYEVASRTGTETVIARRAHSAGQVPFIPLFSQEDEETTFPDGIPIMADACKLANAVFNYSSLKDEIGYKQTFSWLVIPDKKVDVVQVGLNTVFAYDPTMTNAEPKYISPDPQQAAVLRTMIQDGVEQVRQILGVGRGRAEGSMQKSSADAMELEDDDKRSILGDIASEAEKFEKCLAKLVMAYGGKALKAQPDVRVEYSDDYDLRSFTDEISEFLSFRNIGLSPEVDLKARQDLVRKHYSSLPPDELEALVATMTASTPEPAALPQDQLDTNIRGGYASDQTPPAGGNLGAPGAQSKPLAKPNGQPPAKQSDQAA